MGYEAIKMGLSNKVQNKLFKACFLRSNLRIGRSTRIKSEGFKYPFLEFYNRRARYYRYVEPNGNARFPPSSNTWRDIY